MTHHHNFLDRTFKEPISTGTFTTRPVLEDRSPILEVYHDPDGDWQFLCGTTANFDDLKLVCLDCMDEREPALLSLSDLPPGWSAVRRSRNDPWLREPYDSSEDEA